MMMMKMKKSFQHHILEETENRNVKNLDMTSQLFPMRLLLLLLQMWLCRSAGSTVSATSPISGSSHDPFRCLGGRLFLLSSSAVVFLVLLLVLLELLMLVMMMST
jgi:hypothetical protein